GLGRVAGAPDHADQREPAVAAGPEAPRLPRRRNGEVPVRRRRREARGLRRARRLTRGLAQPQFAAIASRASRNAATSTGRISSIRQLAGLPGTLMRSNLALRRLRLLLTMIVGEPPAQSRQGPATRRRYDSIGRMFSSRWSSSIFSQPIGLM